MLATLSESPAEQLAQLALPGFVYEPKYDGIRALVEIQPFDAAQGRPFGVAQGRPFDSAHGRPFGVAQGRPVGRDAKVRIWSRLGNEKTAQFPEVVQALSRFGRRLRAPVLVDGELVAIDDRGEPAGFQRLQGRIHLTRGSDIERVRGGQPVAFIAFDLLWHGDDDLRPLPFAERRQRLTRIFGRANRPSKDSSRIRLSEVATDGRALYRRAVEREWEGVIAKRAESVYRSGKRSPDWLKIKLVKRQEFVVGGWTEPRQSRTHLGALLLGVFEARANPESRPSTRSGRPEALEGRVPNPELIYAGHSGSGFTQAELERVWTLLKKIETPECPFATRPRTNERPHWVQPRLVAEVKFTEWTSDGYLRHPIYLGLRDDKDPLSVRREGPTPGAASGRSASRVRPPSMTPTNVRIRPGSARSAVRRARSVGAPNPAQGLRARELSALADQIQSLEEARRDGMLTLPDGSHLKVTNLTKVFWPKLRVTKGELMRYYVRAAPFILPATDDRPLVMKRFPNGITGKTFYQQRAPDAVPDGVRVEPVAADREVPARLIGGSLLTLLYMTQMAAISQDPWFSRVRTPDAADHAAFDLDPMEGVPFGRVLDVARWLRDELETLGAPGVPKSSGASGLHIYVPLPPDTPYEAGMLFCQIVATIVAHKHPTVATVTRSVEARGKTVYVDYLQNIRGKTLATAYSVRASDYAGASTPFTWKEVDEGINPKDFTIRTLPNRLSRVGDLWARLRTARPADLTAVLKYAEPAVKER
ncbi:MAG: DNA ligase D, partial [Acidobacteria bacterium]|nr:DNA ligase D [Acidobacteriota bacterium]